MSQFRSNSRVTVTGELITTSPLRVGATRGGNDLDLLVLRNGAGQLLVPGDSVAGACRAWLEGCGVSNQEWINSISQLFGPRASRSRGGVPLEAGLLTFADCAFDAPVEARSGVGIDRATGAAAPGIFYGFEVVARGARLPFSLELEVHRNAEQATAAKAIVGSLIAALIDGRIGLGGMRTRGLGGVSLDPETLIIRSFDYSNQEATVRALSGGDRVAAEWLGTSPMVSQQHLVTAKVKWSAAGAVMTKDPADGVAIDTIPLMGAIDQHRVAAVLPGSSIKGVLRSRAEWFCRTLAGVDVAPSMTAPEFLEQVAGLRPVNLLFGSIKSKNSSGRDRDRRGALRVRDCYSTVSIGRGEWDAIIDSPDEQVTARRIDASPVTRGRFDPAMHVAIDRFTGGAAESLLYSVLEVRNSAWKDIELELDLSLLEIDCSESDRLAAIGLFYVLVKMLRNDLVRLGFGSMRGAGRMRVSSVDLEGDDNINRDAALSALRSAWKQEVA